LGNKKEGIMRAMKKRGRFFFSSLALLSLMASFAACHSGPPQITITDVKASMSPAIRGEAMVTMNIVNKGGSDVLTAVKTDIPGAKVSLHVMEGQRMVAVDKLDVSSKSSLEFKMGGSHVMIEDMPATVKKDSKFNLTLVFQKSGEKTIPLTLEGAMNMDMPMEHHHM
jgi:copper(I)-binding protein